MTLCEILMVARVLLKIYDLIFKFRNKSSILDLLFLTVPILLAHTGPYGRERTRIARRGIACRLDSRLPACARISKRARADCCIYARTPVG